MMTERRDYYVYVLCREDGSPFYVGRGRGRRWRDHERLHRQSNSRKNRIIARVMAAGLSVPVEKIAEHLTQAEALALEVSTIRRIGRAPNGPLVNMTDGGDGMRGFRPSRATLECRNASIRAAHARPEVKAKHAAAIRASAALLGAREKRSASAREAALRPDVLERKRAAAQRNAANAKWRAAVSAGLKAVCASPEKRARLSAAAKKGHACPIARAKRAEAIRARWARMTPEERSMRGKAVSAGKLRRRANP